MHKESHPQAGQTVTVWLNGEQYEYYLEDWWDTLTGGSWMHAKGNPAALNYAVRSAGANLPVDNEVVYGKIGPFSHLVHVSEIVNG